jgi:serine/threonine-protein kinase
MTPYMSTDETSGRIAETLNDIFSLGAVLFEMLTGRQRGQGLAPSSINHAVPPELDRLVGMMLAGHVEQRYQSAATVAAELRSIAAILDVRTTAAEAAFEPPRRRQRRSRTRLIAAIVLLLLLAVVAAWFWQHR